MKAPRYGLFVALLLVAGCGSSSSWDPLASIPEPLDLPEEIDDQDAHALYAYGQSLLERNPAVAARAFYWAARLDPTWADPLYGQRMALFMAEPRMFNLYLRGSRQILASPGAQRLDSLYYKALVLNPFLTRREDAPAFRQLILYNVSGGMARLSADEIRYEMLGFMRQAHPRMRGWYAQSEGRLAEAAQHYQDAVDRDRSPAVLADLARVNFLLGRRIDARQAMAEAVDLLHSQDEEDEELVRIYNSKALLEQTLGLIIEETGDQAEARQAYARALQEDLSFHPAHLRLGELALAEGDTLTALSEMALAAEMAAGNTGVHLRYGRVLAAAGRHEEAAAQYRLAIEREPYFAQPHFDLAIALEAAGRPADAAAEYRTFLEKAARSDNGRPIAQQRVVALEAAGAGGAQ